MYQFIQKFHSGWAYVALLLLIIAAANALIGMLSKKEFTALRLTSLEHPLINIIAIALITIGWSKHKKLTTSESKFKTFTIFYGLGLVLILSRIPWSMWL